jgi:hypothetical protein
MEDHRMPKRPKAFPAAKLIKDLRVIEDRLAAWRKELEAALRTAKKAPPVAKAGGPKPIVGGGCPPP